MILLRLLVLAVGTFAVAVRIEGGSSGSNLADSVPTTFLAAGKTVEIKFPQGANYRRIIISQDQSVSGPQIFRVCNGKNKKTCGFWENVQTKKKMASGATSYNKNKKALIVKNLKTSDFGIYTTGNGKIFHNVLEIK